MAGCVSTPPSVLTPAYIAKNDTPLVDEQATKLLPYDANPYHMGSR
ncbi:hypothetical protein [Moraxella cuniculi]|nr:hypothetical protein [Moraxella cuniculi]